MALLAAVCLYATDLNIYASGLNAHRVEGATIIDYTLNAPATTLNVKLYDGANLIATLPITGDANLAKGKHSVEIDITGVTPGTYTWKMEAVGAANTLVKPTLTNDLSNGAYHFYLPQDVIVDNNPESPYFGRVYVSESTVGQSDGGSYTSKNQTRGVYIYNADMTLANGETTAMHGYEGGLAGTNTSRNGFKRLAIDENGYVYVASQDAATKGVYRMDPAHPENAFATVLSASAAVNAIEVIGNTMYTLEGIGLSGTYGVGNFNSYSLASLPVGDPLTTVAQGGADPLIGFVNADCTIRDDHHGGFWICDYRGGLDWPMLVHLNANGERDYYIGRINKDTSGETDSHLDLLPNWSYRGTLGVNTTGDMIAVSSQGRGVIFNVEYDANTGVPTLTKLFDVLTPLNASSVPGSNVDGLAFDVAGNFYMACATRERIQAFAMPKADNSYTTPARAANTIYVPAETVANLYEIGDNQGANWDPEHALAMTKVATNVFEGTFSFSGDVSYFAFTKVQSSDWSVVNTNRIGGATNNELVDDGSVANLATGGEINLTVAPGRYTFRVDLNDNKVYVKGHLFEIGDNSGWQANSGVELTRVSAGIFEGDLTFTAAMSSFAFFKSLADFNDAGGWNYINGIRFAGVPTNDTIDDGNIKDMQNTSGTEKQFKILPGVYHVTVDMNEMEVTLTQSVAKVIVGEAGYATYYKGTKAYTMPTGMTGYVFNVTNRLEEAYAAGDIVPAATPLVLGADAGTYDLVFTTGGVAPTAANNLRGTDADATTTAPGEGVYLFYGLSLAASPNDTPESVGFYWMEDNGAAFTNKAHKAYLALLESIINPEFLAPAILFNENNATNIENVEGQEKAVKFIQDGKLFIQKNGVTYDALGRVVR